MAEKEKFSIARLIKSKKQGLIIAVFFLGLVGWMFSNGEHSGTGLGDASLSGGQLSVKERKNGITAKPMATDNVEVQRTAEAARKLEEQRAIQSGRAETVLRPVSFASEDSQPKDNQSKSFKIDGDEICAALANCGQVNRSQGSKQQTLLAVGSKIVDASGKVYTVGEDGKLYDSEGNRYERTPDGRILKVRPDGKLVDSDGNIYERDASGNLYYIAPNGKRYKVGSDGKLYDENGNVHALVGNKLYRLDNHGNRYLVGTDGKYYDDTGREVTFTDNGNVFRTAADGSLTDLNGNVYERGANGKIYAVAANGVRYELGKDGLLRDSHGNIIEIDEDGNVFMRGPDGKRYIVNADGTLSDKKGNTYKIGKDGSLLLVGKDGRLYTVGSDGRYYDKDGNAYELGENGEMYSVDKNGVLHDKNGNVVKQAGGKYYSIDKNGVIRDVYGNKYSKNADGELIYVDDRGNVFKVQPNGKLADANGNQYDITDKGIFFEKNGIKYRKDKDGKLYDENGNAYELGSDGQLYLIGKNGARYRVDERGNLIDKDGKQVVPSNIGVVLPMLGKDKSSLYTMGADGKLRDSEGNVYERGDDGEIYLLGRDGKRYRVGDDGSLYNDRGEKVSRRSLGLSELKSGDFGVINDYDPRKEGYYAATGKETKRSKMILAAVKRLQKMNDAGKASIQSYEKSKDAAEVTSSPSGAVDVTQASETPTEIEWPPVRGLSDTDLGKMLTTVNSDEKGVVVSKILTGPLKGGILKGDYELAVPPNTTAKSAEAMVIKYTQLRYLDKMYTVKAYAVNEETYKFGLASWVDDHFFERWGSFVFATSLSAIGEAVKANNTTTNVVISTTAPPVAQTTPTLSPSQMGWVVAGAVGDKVTPIVAKNFERPNTVALERGTRIGIMWIDPVVIPNFDRLNEDRLMMERLDGKFR